MCPVKQHRNTGPASRPAARREPGRPGNEPPPTLFDHPRLEPPDGRDPPEPPCGWCGVLTTLTGPATCCCRTATGTRSATGTASRSWPGRRGSPCRPLLGPDGELIHVKRADGSAPLSHLFAQGQVSVDALTYQADARQALIRMVGSHRVDPAFPPRKVIYAIALGAGRTLTVDTLFTFAQVALYRAMKALRNEGVEVEVIGIPAR
jgi:hypothetical protein